MPNSSSVAGATCITLLFCLALACLNGAPSAAPLGSGGASSVPLPATALAYHPASGKLYATIGSRAPLGRANTITTVNPSTAKIERSVFMGSSEPRSIAVSARGRYLHVSLGSLFRRYDTATEEATAYLSWDGGGRLKKIHPHPTDPEALIVLLGDRGGFAGSEAAVLAHGKLLPSRVMFGGEDLIPTIAPSYLYMSGRAALKIVRSGVRLCWGTEQEAPFGGATTVAGLIINSSGFVYDPETRELLGHLPRNAPDLTLTVDRERGSVLRLDEERILQYDLRTLTLAREIPVPGYRRGRHLTRWGEDGLAFATEKEIVLLRAHLGPRLASVDLAVDRSPLQPKPEPGRTITYQLAVENRSRHDCPAAFLTDKIPDGVEVATLRASQGAATAANGVLRAELGPIPAGKRATVDVAVLVTGNDSLRFFAVARGYEPDPDGDNNVSLYPSLPAVEPSPLPGKDVTRRTLRKQPPSRSAATYDE